MRRALAIDEQSYGKDHPERRQRPQQPGAVAAGHQPAGEAEPLMRRALAIDEAILRQGPPQTSPSTSTTWRSCCRPPTAWLRPSR